jgi:hypothetical protein
VVAREKKERAWDPLASAKLGAREEGGEESRDNLSAFCFRRAKVAARGRQGRARKSLPDLKLSERQGGNQGAGATGFRMLIDRSKEATCKDAGSRTRFTSGSSDRSSVDPPWDPRPSLDHV